MSDELKIAIEAAKRGANVALKYFDTKLKVEFKKDESPVTIADRETEQTIKNVILSKFPNAQFLAEETKEIPSSSSFWVIDPIDATHNFVRGIPIWGILISYVKEGKTMVGVSHLPAIGDLTYAELGKGAFCNNNRIYVSKRKQISESFFSHGSLKYFDKIRPGFDKIAKNAEKMRGFGDLFSFNLVAQGKIECMIDGGNEPWDIVPLKLIIEEAGGKFTNHQGKDWTYNDTESLATNGFIHDDVVKTLNS